MYLVITLRCVFVIHFAFLTISKHQKFKPCHKKEEISLPTLIEFDFIGEKRALD